tara:strand:- start:1427 stop:1780 length:354 start_codon:yes stop_codon:yes gene_type:complete
MDRAEQDHFAADNIAHETSIAIKDMLNSMSCVKYKDQSSNESYEFLILNPKHTITVNVKYRIRLVFPEVSFVTTWIDTPKPLGNVLNGLTGIDRKFKEAEIDAEFDWMSNMSDHYDF